MLIGKVLNSEATLNNYIYLLNKAFIQGSAFKLVIQIFNEDLGIRYIPDIDAEYSITLNNLDGTTLVKDGVEVTVFEDDRSIMSIDISAEESEALQGGNITFMIDETKGIVRNAISRVIEGADCGC